MSLPVSSIAAGKGAKFQGVPGKEDGLGTETGSYESVGLLAWVFMGWEACPGAHGQLWLGIVLCHSSCTAPPAWPVRVGTCPSQVSLCVPGWTNEEAPSCLEGQGFRVNI